uniref:NADH dehydrogenase subunit 2 n=1 Tax=Polytomella magna TaxID=353565 RepID=V5JDX2_9CHLO|nr:NADH dehydrogenase subunit 2 [Polytomella magna]AGK83098.1 NADH dehydrogenase subunit 2 [Polytomella magna]
MMHESLLGLDCTLNILFVVVYGLLQCGTSFPKSNGIQLLTIFAMLSAVPHETQPLILCVISILSIMLFRGFFPLVFFMFSFFGNLYAIAVCSVLAIYVCFELQSLCLVILSKVSSNNTNKLFVYKAALKYLLFSVIAGSVLLFYTSLIFAQTGVLDCYTMPVYFFMLFKIGAAPFHMYMLELFTVVPRALALYLTTIPKYSVIVLLCSLNIDCSLTAFALSSLAIGSLSAFQGVFLRNLILYSSVTEIGLILLVLNQGFTGAAIIAITLYFMGTFLLWNSSNNKVIAIATMSTAGLPPLAGFFGKVQLLTGVVETGNGNALAMLLLAQFIAFVAYLRIIRIYLINYANNSISQLSFNINNQLSAIFITLLIFLSNYLIKPFLLV